MENDAGRFAALIIGPDPVREKVHAILRSETQPKLVIIQQWLSGRRGTFFGRAFQILFSGLMKSISKAVKMSSSVALAISFEPSKIPS